MAEETPTITQEPLIQKARDIWASTTVDNIVGKFAEMGALIKLHPDMPHEALCYAEGMCTLWSSWFPEKPLPDVE